MIRRKVYNIDEVDTSVPPGGVVSISPYWSCPNPASKLEMFAMGIFINKYIEGDQIYMYSGYPYNHDDVSFRDSNGKLIVINHDYADIPDASYAIVPYRVVNSESRLAFSKNFVIVDKRHNQFDYLTIQPISTEADARFIPISVESLLDNNMRFAIDSL